MSDPGLPFDVWNIMFGLQRISITAGVVAVLLAFWVFTILCRSGKKISGIRKISWRIKN